MSLAIIVKNIITHLICNVISPEHCTLYTLFFILYATNLYVFLFLFFFVCVLCINKDVKKNHSVTFSSHFAGNHSIHLAEAKQSAVTFLVQRQKRRQEPLTLKSKLWFPKFNENSCYGCRLTAPLLDLTSLHNVLSLHNSFIKRT